MHQFSDELLKSGPVRGQREAALQILAAALEAADPGEAVKRFMRLQDDRLVVAGRSYDLADYARVLVVGGGKAGATMAAAVEEVLGDRVNDGVVNVKYGHVAPTRVVKIREAAHPVPDEAGIAGTREMVDVIEGAGPRDLVITVVSG